jgi:hypothetical protein
MTVRVDGEFERRRGGTSNVLHSSSSSGSGSGTSSAGWSLTHGDEITDASFVRYLGHFHHLDLCIASGGVPNGGEWFTHSRVVSHLLKSGVGGQATCQSEVLEPRGGDRMSRGRVSGSHVQERERERERERRDKTTVHLHHLCMGYEVSRGIV